MPTSDADELAGLDIADAAKRLRAREISSVQLTTAMLARIADLDVSLKSYLHVAPELALAQAKAADAELAAGRWRGPLHGIPVALKDMFWTTTMPTTAGMPLRAGYMAPHDASVVRRLVEAGAVLLGKLNQTEGAVGENHPAIAPPINPWEASAWPGASSNGSGVAVAAGLCFAAMGTDTGGSIRFPSAANGVTGLKPSWGRVSRHGVFALSEPLDCMGPLARSVADAAIVLAAIAGVDPLDPTSSPAPVPDYLAALDGGVDGLKIGVDRQLLGDADALTGQTIEAALKAFASLGAQIVETRLEGIDDATRTWWALCSAGAAHAHRDTFPGHAQAFGPSLRRAVEHGNSLSATDLIAAVAEREGFRARLARLFQDIDLFILPVQAAAGPSLGDMAAFSQRPNARELLLRFVAPFALTGQPVLVVPGGATPARLPIGFQLVGPPMGEPVLLRAGHSFQKTTDWHRRRPPRLTAGAPADRQSRAR
jgi:amidase